jgi:hypothetical protein
MNELLTYYDIYWTKYLYLFNQIDNLQVIFIIKKEDALNCLEISDNLFDITYSKIRKISDLGPFITLKNLTINFNKNIEEGIINFFSKNKYYKWVGIVDENIEKKFYFPNTFSKYILKTNNICYLIPYRNRKEHLEITITKLNEYIKYNNLEADICVIEQTNSKNWNKGATINCGFTIIKNFYKYIIFNDVDTFSKLDNSFIYPNVDEIIHIFGYNYCLGGIFTCLTDTFCKINGFNNNFNNWGREDRDLEDRAKANGIKINRNYLINLNMNNITQLQHDNKNNYWNYKLKDTNYFKSRESYYFNQIEHYKKDYQNGLSSLKLMDPKNYTILIKINLIKWTQGTIVLLNNNFEFLKLELKPNKDTGIILVNSNIELPINPEEKYPKILIEISNEKLIIQTSYIQKKEVVIKKNLKKNKIEIIYNNIELDFDNIFYKNFNKLEYNYFPNLKKNYYSFNVIF